MNYDVSLPENTIFRINLAWINDLETLKNILHKHEKHKIFIDLPKNRTKPPNNRYSMEEIKPILESYENIKYFTISKSNSVSISIDDQIVNNLPPKERDIAMVFQSYALYPHMTVFDNMAFALKLEKRSKEEINERVYEAAKILQIENFLQRKPKQLSGGQRQRVAIGRAITRKPKVFLFDEPLSNLDAALRVQMRVELAKLHDQLNATMIYVTHDQTEAMTLADDIVVLDQAIVSQKGSPMDLYYFPNNI